MKDLELIKSSKFNGIECDIYSNEKDMFMTTEQLGNCLGYEYAKQAISKIMDRNKYLKNKEFSKVVKMGTLEGDRIVNREVRIFTEDGIYEVTMLAKTEKAKEFRAFIRKLLKSLRKGETKIVKMTEYQKQMAEAKLNNSRARMASILMKIAEQTSVKEYKDVCCSYASACITGKPLLPLPEASQKTYSATDIANILGTNPNKIGRISNENNLKTDKYGKWFYDKSKNSVKQVETFRYYENAIQKFKELI